MPLFFLNSCGSTSSDGNSQKATLFFRAQKEVAEINIYRPIDDTYNSYFVSDKLKINPGKGINYEIDVNKFEFIKWELNGRDFILLAEPGDRIEITCDYQEITISGSNAEGNRYLNNVRISSYWDLLEQHITKAPLDYDSIYYYLQKELIEPYLTTLEEMERSESISPIFSEALGRDLYFACCGALNGIYKQWLIFNRTNYLIENFKPSEEDIRNIIQQLSSLYDTPYAMNGDAKKMPHHSDYYSIKYKYLDREAKEELLKKFDGDFWRPYILLSPDSLQLLKYGNELIYALQTKNISSRVEKAILYLSEKFPDSEYITIIEELRN